MVGGGGRMAPLGGACEKFSKFSFDPNELKSPKTTCLFIIFLFRVGGSDP